MSKQFKLPINSVYASDLISWGSSSAEDKKRQGTTSVVPKSARKEDGALASAFTSPSQQKGTGFSPYMNSSHKSRALAPEGIFTPRHQFTACRINWALRTFLLAITIAFLVAWAVVGHAATAPTPDATALLKRSDTYRNGWPAYSLRVKITDFEAGKSDEEHFYEVSQKGTDKTYVEFLTPREKGRHLLMIGDDMWIYLPDTSRPVRITPLERLSGDASNGDVARTNYAVDYSAEYVREEKVGDQNCYVLNLTAKRKGATYQRILYWVRVEDSRPVRAEFYLTSGKHIKSATFDDYKDSGGRLLLRKLTLYDEIRHNSHSVLEYSNMAPHDLPDKLFYQGRADRF